MATRPCYAGIGARTTPAPVLGKIAQLSARLGEEGWTLRTGLSPGADQAFYRGARRGGGAIELYLPWAGFEQHARERDEGPEVSERDAPAPPAYELSMAFHRAWDGRGWSDLDERERMLLARDAHQVLGGGLDSPAAYVICWTADSGIDGESPLAQGTGQALRIARAHGVPVLNLARNEHLDVAQALRLPCCGGGGVG